MIGGLGKIGDQSFMFIGQQRVNTKMRQYRNFGMAIRRVSQSIEAYENG